MQKTLRNLENKKNKNILKPEVLKLKERLQEVAYLRSSAAVLDWDHEVNMPKKAAESRAKTLAALHGVIHEKFLNINHDNLLTNLQTNLKKDLESKKMKRDSDEAVIIREAWRNFDRIQKLPKEFVQELVATTSLAQSVWAQARAKSDFSFFQPHLEKIVNLKRREAEYVDYKDSKYDALLDDYEPEMSTREVQEVLNNLKKFLINFLPKVLEEQNKKRNENNIEKILKNISGNYNIQDQYVFNKYLSEKIGYDLEAGRIDISTHPFTTSFHPTDVRFTTRYKTDNVLYALGSTIHEAGHALYEQGLNPEYFGTGLGEALSLGIHESQSRMWENMIGKSSEFWKFFFPKLQKHFAQNLQKNKAFQKIAHHDLAKVLNHVSPSYIRTEADEVTYNLHIILRFEIEKDLIEGKLEVKNIPEIWNKKMQEYLGVQVKKDALGVLQDVYWSAGLFGYFATYSLGNLYAAQFYHKMLQDIPDMQKQIASGNFKNILMWLRENIHKHGKRYSAQDLVKRVTGERLNSKYFENYLTQKYLSS